MCLCTLCLSNMFEIRTVTQIRNKNQYSIDLNDRYIIKHKVVWIYNELCFKADTSSPSNISCVAH